jgi:23S rRNA (guanine745-N1)-methyltransferase
MIWRCPVCDLALGEGSGQLLCDKDHSFDIARQGYVNLLPANHKKSVNPGDSRAMLQARRAFLNAGHYQPIIDALGESITAVAARKQGVKAKGAKAQSIKALDIGGGEGYFAAQLSQEGVCWFLTDIAKDAVRMASAQVGRTRCAVASSYNLPVRDACLDLILRNFAPSDDTELHRVLKPEGELLLVVPGENHLCELRAMVYRQAQLHKPAVLPKGFTVLEESRVTFKTALLDTDDRVNLLAMTPMLWSASEQSKENWSNAQPIAVTVDVNILRLSR